MNGSSGDEASVRKAWALALVAAVAFLLLPFVSGLLGAAVLYVLIEPLLRRFDDVRRRRLAAFSGMFLTFFALVVPGLWLLGELMAQVPDAIASLQGNEPVQRFMRLHLGGIEVGAVLGQATNEIVSWSSRQTIAAIGGALSATLNLMVALFGAYYLLTDRGQMWPTVRRRLPVAETVADALLDRFHRVTEAMVLGVVFAAIAQGSLVGLALWALGFPQYLLWAAVTAAASVLPIFGSGLVWIPAAGVLLAQQRYGGAVFLLAYGALLVSNVDNVLRLVVYRRVSRVHPMVTLVGAFAGVKVFGLAGLLLGPLLLHYAVELMSLNDRSHVGVSPLPTPGLADTAGGRPALT